MNNKTLAGALAIGALSLTFGGCSTIENMMGKADYMTAADACVRKAVQKQENEVASVGGRYFEMTVNDMQKIKTDCEGKGDFKQYLIPKAIRSDLGK